MQFYCNRTINITMDVFGLSFSLYWLRNIMNAKLLDPNGFSCLLDSYLKNNFFFLIFKEQLFYPWWVHLRGGCSLIWQPQEIWHHGCCNHESHCLPQFDIWWHHLVIFFFLIVNQKILFIRKRGIVQVHKMFTSEIPNYGLRKNGESVDHLLRCKNVRALWMKIFNKVDLVWVMPAFVVALLASWPPLGGITQISTL